MNPRKLGPTKINDFTVTHEERGQPQQHFNLICISQCVSLLPTFILISESIVEESPKNRFWTKGNNSWQNQKWWKLRLCIALFAVAKGGCCSISDDLSCSWSVTYYMYSYESSQPTFILLYDSIYLRQRRCMFDDLPCVPFTSSLQFIQNV